MWACGTAVRVGVDLRLVSQTSCGGHPPPPASCILPPSRVPGEQRVATNRRAESYGESSNLVECRVSAARGRGARPFRSAQRADAEVSLQPEGLLLQWLGHPVPTGGFSAPPRPPSGGGAGESRPRNSARPRRGQRK